MPRTLEHASTSGRIAFLALCAVPVLVPLAMSNLTAVGLQPITQDQFNVAKLLVLALCLTATWVAWGIDLLTGGTRVRWSRLSMLVLAFLALAVLSTVTSLHMPTALLGSTIYKQGLLAWTMYASLTLIAVQLVDSAEKVKRLGSATVLGGVPVALYALVQSAGLDPASWAGLETFAGARAISTIGNPDMLGGYLILPLMLAPALALTHDSTRGRALYWMATAIIAAAWFLALSRGAWIGGAVAVAALVFALRRHGVRLGRLDRVWLGAGAAFITVTGIVIVASSRAGLLSRLNEIATFGGGSEHRLLLYAASLRAIAERPLFGTGPDTFRLAWWPLRQAADVTLGGANGIADDAHSLPLMLAATMGVPAALALLALIAGALRSTRGALLTSASPGGSERLVTAAWWAGLLGLTTHLLLSVGTIGTAVPLFLSVGVLLAARARAVSLAALARAAVTATVVVCSLALLAFSVITWRADAAYGESYRLEGEAALAAASAAETALPWRLEYRTRTAELLAERARTVMSYSPEAGTEELAEATRAYGQLTAFAPREYPARVAYAALLTDAASLEGSAALEAAVEQAAEAIEIQPNGIAARTVGAAAMLNLGRFRDAAAVLEPVWDLDRGTALPGVLYAESLYLSGDLAAARDVVEELADLFPGDADVSRVQDLISQPTTTSPTP